jgi:PAS domain S-box-containing protein
MLSTFRDNLILKELRNLRLLIMIASIVVTSTGIAIEFVFHEHYILISGLACAVFLISNYILSFYHSIYRKNFTTISYISLFVIHFWALYVVRQRSFDVNYLLPLSISVFTCSLVFNSINKSVLFILTITTTLLALMLMSGSWQTHYTVAVTALYTGALLSGSILKRKNDFHDEIQKQEKRYLSLVENMNDGLLYIVSGLIVFINEKFVHISGFTRNEMIGQKIEKFFPEIDPGAFTGSFLSEILFTHKTGESIWLRILATPVMPNANGTAGVGTMLMCTDISKLKTTQDILKKREEGYRTFIDQSAVGIWRAEYMNPIPTTIAIEKQIDLLLDTGIISECNEFMAQMYGYSGSSELIGRRIRDFYYIENNFDEEKTRGLMHAFVTNNYRISNAESKELDRNGIVRYMLNNNIGIIENGMLIRTWGVQTDITDRKKTERELTESNQELDTFFYKASHDLKGPLASVMGIVNLARLERNDDSMEKYFGMIEKSVTKLDRTLLDLIELARTRKGTSKITQISIKGIVEEILTSLRHMPGFNKINFEIKIDHALELNTDKVLLNSVLQNLIHNAINYCNHDRPWIKIAAKDTDDGIEIEIADNGKGIPDTIRHRVFEMFYRGNTESTGSGLGLFIVKNALEKMNGAINLSSIPGQGTTFTVSIPDAVEALKI